MPAVPRGSALVVRGDEPEKIVRAIAEVRRTSPATAIGARLIAPNVDAQLAIGAHEPVAADLALDGIHEVLDVFAPRQVRLGRSQPMPYGLVLVTPSGTVTAPGPDPVTVTGSEQDVLKALWRRPAAVEVSDPTAWDAVLSSGLTP